MTQLSFLASNQVPAKGPRRDCLSIRLFCQATINAIALLVGVGCHQASNDVPAAPPPPPATGKEATLDSTAPVGSTSTEPLSYIVSDVISQFGCCDGSASVALDEDHFLVANDEDSVLRIYRRRDSSRPVHQTNLRKFLDLKKKNDESDIEGMTVVGSTVFAIASHSRSKDGDKRKGRRQLFALNVEIESTGTTLHPLGKPYTKLLKDLEESPKFQDLDFESAARLSSEEAGGINIEGLTSTPEGSLLIGFRTPIHRGGTLLIEIKNPKDIVRGAKPIFGAARRLSLGTMGIRAIERVNNDYLLATETNSGKRYPQLFQWNGSDSRPRRVFVSLPKSLNPESILIFPDTGLTEIHILSDDGNETLGKEPCSKIDDETKQRFRRLVLKRQGASQR